MEGQAYTTKCLEPPLAGNAPFPQTDELYRKLLVNPRSDIPERSPTSNKTTLPGEPRVPLTSPRLSIFLQNSLTTPDLNTFTPHLWKVATQSSAHITALTSQLVRGRTIILSENPELHLVWIHNRIYIKPIPKYLFSFAFWSFYLDSSNRASPISYSERIEIGKAAKGFLRSYAYLIRHKSDFTLAKHHGLIPKRVRYSEFTKFILHFEDLADSDVSPRYSYGELRLSRLNLWSIVALGRLEFHKSVWQYSSYFARFYGPMIFAFAGIAVVLGAMQVGLSVSEKTDNFEAFCWGTAITTLVGVAVVILFLLLILLLKISRETVFALRSKVKKRKSRIIEKPGERL